ncbi:MAG: CPBP family intramembrane metalloprotease [Clostridia bacterium]|nr:CPBP family intramembrane metalloprotease [Clostridia bacterium]
MEKMNETWRAGQSYSETSRITIVYLLVTVFIYGAVYFASVYISAFTSFVSVFVFSAALVAVLRFKGRTGFYRISMPEIETPAMALRILPLLIVPVFQLVKFGLPVPEAEWFLLAGAALTEEIIFRGYFPRLFSKMPRFVLIMFSAAVFALFHFVNLLSAPSFSVILKQFFCAFCAGVLFSAVTLDFDSLLPPFFAHFFINCTTPQYKTVFSLSETLPWIAVLAFGLLFAAKPADYHQKGL